MMAEETVEKKAKQVEVRVVGNLEHRGRTVPVGDKVTLRADQVERLAARGVIERIK